MAWQKVKFESIKQTYSFEAHKPEKLACITHLVCSKCGLIYLRNSLTAWCIQVGCNSEFHPQFKSKVKELSSTTPGLHGVLR